MTITEPIVDILIHVDPNLDYGPDWMPEPSPPVKIPLLTARGDWSDVFDWIKAHAILPAGTPIDSQYVSVDQVQQMIDAAVGSTVKALSGFLNQSAALTIQAASLLEDAIDNLDSRSLTLNAQLTEQVDRIEATQNAIVAYALPSLSARIQGAIADGYAFALAAEDNANRWAVTNIAYPLLENIGQVQANATQQVDTLRQQVPNIVRQIVPTLGLATATALATVASKASALSSWVDDCGEPMCESMGPKTDLGKLLKSLKVAEWAALLAEIAALRAGGLDSLVGDIGDWAGKVIDELESVFVVGGKTLGDTLANLP